MGAAALVVTIADTPEMDDVPIVAVMAALSVTALLGVNVVVAVPVEPVEPEVGVSDAVNPVVCGYVLGNDQTMGTPA